jgi:hypothetical protein
MKNLKSLLFALITIVFLFSSCEDTSTNPQVQEGSQATLDAIEALGLQFNADGSLNTTTNPTGNIIFDYCFDFVYPLALSYNNGTQITVNSLDELGNIIATSTETLYITNIQLPFDVEVQDSSTNGTIIQTINNEDEFITLVAFCEFGVNDCIYTANFSPVCVTYTDANGDTETIQFQNMSYAACEGFTSADVVSCDNDDCEVSNLEITVGDCNLDGTYSITIDFETAHAYNQYFDVYTRNNTIIGTYELINLPITISNFVLSGETEDYIKVAVNDYTDCYQETEWLAPSCVATCWDFVYPIEIYVNGNTSATTISSDTVFNDYYNSTANQIIIAYPVDITIGGTTYTVANADELSTTYGWFDNRCD